MKHQTLFKKLFFCLIFLFSAMAMAQHKMDDVIPGIDGPLPILDHMPPGAAEGTVGCLHLEKVNSYVIYFNGDPIFYFYADLKFPYPSIFGAESYTLQIYDSKSDTWKDFLYNNEVCTTTGDNFSIDIKYLGNEINFRLKLNGGVMDGYVSNSVLVKQQQRRSRMTSWSSDFGYKEFVGDVFEQPEFHMEAYNAENKKFETVMYPYSYCTYKWYRRNPNSYEMTLIEGADSATYTATADDVGYQLVLLIEGDDEHYSLLFQVESPIIRYPIYSSFEYKGSDGFIINTNYILPEEVLSMINISCFGEYDTVTQTMPMIDIPINEIVTIKEGQYAFYCDSLTDIIYDFHLPNNQYSLIQTCTMFENRMVEGLYAGFYSQPMHIQTELDGVPVVRDIELLKKNISGGIEIVNIADSIMHIIGDTIVLDMIIGDYYIRVPGSADNETTYFSNTPLWSDADIVNHPSYTLHWKDSIFVVKLINAIVPTTGSGVVEGEIYEAIGDLNAPARSPFNNHTQNAYTLYLRDANNNLIAKTVSDTDGAYRFSDIPFGEYDVIIDAVGYRMLTQPHHVALTEENASVSGVDYSVTNDGVEARSIPVGVKSVKTDRSEKDDIVYDLNGRVINAIPEQGLFIRNGKIHFSR